MTALIAFPKTGFTSFEEMYKTEHSFVYNIVFQRIRERTMAEEITQDAFMRVLRSINAYSPQEEKTPRDSFKNWLGTIAKNAALNHLKRKKLEETKQHYTTMSGDYNFSNPEELTQTKEELEGISQSIDALADCGIREASRLRFLKGLSYQEIGEQLDIPKGTVMSRIHRGKKQIEQKYERR